MRRLMPYLFVLFVIAYLDRVNVGYAALQMKGDLSFTDEVLGFGAGVFFWGYFLLEIPGSILIVYLSHWFRYEDRAKTVALFMAAQPISNIIGSPVSGLLLGVNWLGLAGWRWLFIIEGMPAVIFGVVTIFYLTDWPHQAHWLPDDEREWLTSQLESEKQAKHSVRSYRILEAFRHREVILLTLTYFFIVSTVYGFTFWLPTIIKKQSGSSNLRVSLISAVPYCVGLVAILVIGWSSDRTKERRWHTALSMMAASVGLLMAVVLQDHLVLTVAMFCVVAVGIYGYLPGFWALPGSFLTGTAAAASIGLINSLGNLGGWAGPYVVGFLSKETGSYFGGVLYLSASALVAAVLVLSIRATKRARLLIPEAANFAALEE